MFGVILFGIVSCSEVSPNNTIADEERIEKRDEDCKVEIPYGDGPCSLFGRQFTTSIDGYPGCTFTISYGGGNCVDIFTGDQYYYVEQFSLLAHDCEEYNMDIEDAIADGSIESFSKEFEDKLYELVLYNIAENIILPWNHFVVNYRTSSCSKFCYSEMTLPSGNQSILVPSKVKCGEGCCEYFSDVWNSYTGINFSTEIINSDLSDCSDVPDGQYCKGKEIRYSTDCLLTCE